jgi:hypothetical protein
MFDVSKHFPVKLITPEGTKTVVVSMPSDQQWSDWRRKKKVKQTDLGRRKSTMEMSKGEQIDLDLVNAIRQEQEGVDPFDIDMEEAARVLNTLSICEVSEQPERDGSVFVINLKVMRRFDTVHRVRVPSVKDSQNYQRQRSSVVFGAYNTSEFRINLDASKKLYDAIVERSEGYVGAIPVIHKAEVVNVLLQEIEALQEEVDEPGE